MLTSLSIPSTEEPAPSGWAAAAAREAVKTTKEDPNIVFPLLAILVPLAVLGAFVYLFVKYGLPRLDAWQAAWRTEKETDRKHLADLFDKRDKENAEDIEAARKLAATQHEGIVQRVELRVERITGAMEKVDVKMTDASGKIEVLTSKVDRLLTAMGGKITVFAVLVVIGIGIGCGGFSTLGRYLWPTVAAAVRPTPMQTSLSDCDPACTGSMVCTTSGCSEVKSGTATSVAVAVK